MVVTISSRKEVEESLPLLAVQLPIGKEPPVPLAADHARDRRRAGGGRGSESKAGGRLAGRPGDTGSAIGVHAGERRRGLIRGCRYPSGPGT